MGVGRARIVIKAIAVINGRMASHAISWPVAGWLIQLHQRDLK